MNKNLKWAQENNELTNQLIDIEDQLIKSKLHIANLATLNDRLTHSRNKKHLEIKRLNRDISKYKTDPPKTTKLKTEGTENSI
mmetsp:Transcript_32912/g.29201  ORF Transcript_32912/g.29201 Transcript_32912/m.29201 type:complete len:83 (+) Transcript_32912:291-539(+)